MVCCSVTVARGDDDGPQQVVIMFIIIFCFKCVISSLVVQCSFRSLSLRLNVEREQCSCSNLFCFFLFFCAFTCLMCRHRNNVKCLGVKGASAFKLSPQFQNSASVSLVLTVLLLDCFYVAIGWHWRANVPVLACPPLGPLVKGKSMT